MPSRVLFRRLFPSLVLDPGPSPEEVEAFIRGSLERALRPLASPPPDGLRIELFPLPLPPAERAQRLEELRLELGEMPIDVRRSGGCEVVILCEMSPDADVFGRWEGEGGAPASGCAS